MSLELHIWIGGFWDEKIYMVNLGWRYLIIMMESRFIVSQDCFKRKRMKTFLHCFCSSLCRFAWHIWICFNHQDRFSIIVWNRDRISRNSSSCPEVGRYAVYAMTDVSVLESTYLTPQNLLETIGKCVINLSIDLFHPRAVPCQTGPDWRIRSSVGVNMSAEVVVKQ